MRQRIESLEQFRALQADYMAARDAEKRKILVCCGTGCVAGGGRRGSALRPGQICVRWEAVFRRERRPASLDRPCILRGKRRISPFFSASFDEKECQK